MKAFQMLRNINKKQFIRCLSNKSYNHNRFGKEITINGTKETIFIKDNFPPSFKNDILRNKTIATLGYGPQAMSQSLNLKDNGHNVIVGVRKSEDPNSSWMKAIEDDWIPDKNLFEIDEATHKGDIVQYLLSDAGQIDKWSSVKSNLKENSALYFSHGFGIVYNDKTKIIPDKNIDVILIAPKGPGIFVRQNFLNKDHVNASWAVHQNSTGNAVNTALAMGLLLAAIIYSKLHSKRKSQVIL